MENPVHGHSFCPDLSARLEIFSEWKGIPQHWFSKTPWRVVTS
jgi:hypothetical protein